MPNPTSTAADVCVELFAKATADKIKKPEREAASAELVAGLVKTPAAVQEMKLFSLLDTALQATGKKDAGKRHAAALILEGVASKLGAAVEPETLKLFSATLNLLGDKQKPVREAGEAAVDTLFAGFNPNAIKLILDQLSIKSSSPASNEKRLNLIAEVATKHSEQTKKVLTTIIPAVALDIHDIKTEVGDAARKAVLALCKCCTNVDVLPVIPALVGALEAAENVSDCVYQLASTTFVEIVDTATLSLLCPILVSGFRGRDNKVKRGCARIVDNMTTLVEDSRDVAPFLGQLMPLMESAAKNIPNPEYRVVCTKAIKTLTEKAELPPAFSNVTVEEVLPTIKATVGKKYDTEANAASLEYAAEITCIVNLAGGDGIAGKVATAIAPYLAFTGKDANKLVTEISGKVARKDEDMAEEIAEENAEQLCDCDFSLAYGNKVLLKKTRLVLYRGLRYGLIGKNDSGKTSLMRAIAEYRVDGFPSADELRTVFVETDIKAEYADINIVDYMEDEPMLKKMNLGRKKIEETLLSFGFVEGAPATLKNTCGTLSGGWRMKLALSRAMLLNADILLLDEPTNHLDAYNVKWVEDYLMSLDRVTSIMVSHDSGLLDRVTTNMIQIDKYKVNFFQGNLSAFVARFPTAKSYFELKSSGGLVFHFPQPGALSGVTSKGKAIMKMNDISFTYPGVEKAQLNHVTCNVSLGSRVACVGVNGAGKSTMIKLLTGELQPDEGSGKIWSHPNLRVGYIAQHAFFHIEKKLDMNANEYVRWRYCNGNDREEQAKVTNTVTEAEQKLMDLPMVVTSVDKETGLNVKSKVLIGRLTEGRRTNKAKQDQEYECTIKNNTSALIWVLRKDLLKAGWEKVLNQCDSRIATRAAMYAQPLTTENVRKHYEHVGLEEEFSTHVRMSSLSGGQKVKVVLGAAMWNKPHVLILDEPTNYLDRESLGALATAIREFEGGVVMITHNSQFCDNLCPVVWHLQNNTLDIKGDAEWMKEMGMEAVKEEKKLDKDELVDKYGNTITLVKDAANMTNKEKKKRIKALTKINRDRKKKGLEPLHMDEMEEEDWP